MRALRKRSGRSIWRVIKYKNQKRGRDSLDIEDRRAEGNGLEISQHSIFHSLATSKSS